MPCEIPDMMRFDYYLTRRRYRNRRRLLRRYCRAAANALSCL